MKAAAATLLLVAVHAAEQTPSTVSPADAGRFRGRVVTVCGIVHRTDCQVGEGRMLVFNPEAKFRVVIPPTVPEPRVQERFFDQEVCATGRVDEREDVNQIAVDDLAQIRVVADSGLRIFAPHAYRPGCDPYVENPRLIKEAKPVYTRRAKEAGVEGSVLMEIVVEADGTVGDTWIVKSLRSDLDRQAMLAVKEWRFQPATLKGEPVAVIVSIHLTFTLKH